MKRSVTVFICSTFSDLHREREAVMDAVRRLQLQHDSMEFFGARSGQPLETCLAEVRKSDILVVIVGHRYGTITQERSVSFSEAEYEEGHRLRKPCLVYIRDDEVPILPRLMETDPEKLRLLNRWKATLRTRHTVAAFQQGHDLAVQVAADLSRAVRDLVEAEEEKDKPKEPERPVLTEEVSMLVLQAMERGLDEHTVLSIVRRGLTSAVATEQSKGPRVFLSYSNADKEIVRRFAHGLDARGVFVWFDEMRLHAGEAWGRAIEEALDSSDYIAFFMSVNSTRRGYVQKELNLAFERSRMMAVGRPFIVPILLDRAAIPDMPPLLRDIQWLDATDGDVPRAVDRFCEAVLDEWRSPGVESRLPETRVLQQLFRITIKTPNDLAQALIGTTWVKISGIESITFLDERKFCWTNPRRGDSPLHTYFTGPEADQMTLDWSAVGGILADCQFFDGNTKFRELYNPEVCIWQLVPLPPQRVLRDPDNGGRKK